MPVLYGTKVGMTRIYDGDVIVPVTVIECLPNDIVQIKSETHDGVDSLKVAVGVKRKSVSKPIEGEYKKANVGARAFLREVPLSSFKGEAKAGAQIKVDILEPGKLVDVTGHNKGRGYAGVMKRHNFSGHKATHGTMQHRAPGAIGCRMDPGRVFKGQRMAGRWGNEQVTIKNLKIVSIDTDKNLVVLRGAIPGPNGGLIAITQN